MQDFDAEFERATDDAVRMEALYRRNRDKFSSKIRTLAQDGGSPLVSIWKARIDYRSDFDTLLLVTLGIVGIVCWIPLRTLMEFHEPFTRELVWEYFPFIFFALWGIAISILERKALLGLVMFLVAAALALVVHLYPYAHDSQTQQLSLLHSYLLLWSFVPFVAVRSGIAKGSFGMNYVARTGEAICWAALFIVGGIFLSVVSLGLLSALGFQVYDFYFKNIVSLGLVLAPFLGLYFSGDFNELKISNILSKIFAPIATLAVVSFLIAALLGYQKLFDQKDAFTFFSIVPMVVIALLFFLNIPSGLSRVLQYINLCLTSASIVFVALIIPPAIYRIATWGMTANKAAVLGIDVLLLVAMVVILIGQIAVLRGKVTHEHAANTMARFLPAFWGWSTIVVLIFPVVFGFK